MKTAAHLLDDQSSFQSGTVAARLLVLGLSDEMLRVRLEQLLTLRKDMIGVVFESGTELPVVCMRIPSRSSPAL